MSDDTPKQNGALSLQDRLTAIEEKLDHVLERFEGIPMRTRALEIVVYGACGIVLLAFASSVIGLHVNQPPSATAPVLAKP